MKIDSTMTVATKTTSMASAATTYNMLMLIKAMSAVPSYTIVRWANVVLHVFPTWLLLTATALKTTSLSLTLVVSPTQLLPELRFVLCRLTSRNNVIAAFFEVFSCCCHCCLCCSFHGVLPCSFTVHETFRCPWSHPVYGCDASLMPFTTVVLVVREGYREHLC